MWVWWRVVAGVAWSGWLLSLVCAARGAGVQRRPLASWLVAGLGLEADRSRCPGTWLGHGCGWRLCPGPCWVPPGLWVWLRPGSLAGCRGIPNLGHLGHVVRGGLPPMGDATVFAVLVGHPLGPVPSVCFGSLLWGVSRVVVLWCVCGCGGVGCCCCCGIVFVVVRGVGALLRCGTGSCCFGGWVAVHTCRGIVVLWFRCRGVHWGCCGLRCVVCWGLLL